MGPNPSPISTEHTAKLWSPRVARWAEVARGASPPAAAGHLPAVARLSPAWRGRCLRFGEGFPSHITRSGSRRPTDASAGSGVAVLFRPVPGGSRVPAGTEITMQRAEAARRSQAETAGATPPLRDCSRRRPALSQIGGGSSRARLLVRQARAAPICPRRGALPCRNIRGRGGRSAGSGGRSTGCTGCTRGGGGSSSRTPSSAPAAPPPSLPSRGKGLRRRLLRARGHPGTRWRVAVCCEETGCRWKVQKEIKIEGWGPEQLRRNSGPRSHPQVTRLHGCVLTPAHSFQKSQVQRSETKETIQGFFGVAKSMIPRVFGDGIADSSCPLPPTAPTPISWTWMALESVHSEWLQQH